MKQRIHQNIKQLQKAVSRCSRFVRTLRILYCRRQLHRQLCDSGSMLVLLHQDIFSLDILMHLYPEIAIWLMSGYQLRLRKVKEKTTDGNIGLILLCYGGKLICRTMIRMQQVESGVIVFGIHAIDSQLEVPSLSLDNSQSCS